MDLPGHTRCFRAHVSAAPLKRAGILADKGTAGAFPRSRERGPIEANKANELYTLGWEFPRSRERGPIEAGFTYFTYYRHIPVSALT